MPLFEIPRTILTCPNLILKAIRYGRMDEPTQKVRKAIRKLKIKFTVS